MGPGQPQSTPPPPLPPPPPSPPSRFVYTIYTTRSLLTHGLFFHCRRPWPPSLLPAAAALLACRYRRLQPRHVHLLQGETRNRNMHCQIVPPLIGSRLAAHESLPCFTMLWRRPACMRRLRHYPPRCLPTDPRHPKPNIRCLCCPPPPMCPYTAHTTQGLIAMIDKANDHPPATPVQSHRLNRPSCAKPQSRMPWACPCTSPPRTTPRRAP